MSVERTSRASTPSTAAAETCATQRQGAVTSESPIRRRASTRAPSRSAIRRAPRKPGSAAVCSRSACAAPAGSSACRSDSAEGLPSGSRQRPIFAGGAVEPRGLRQEIVPLWNARGAARRPLVILDRRRAFPQELAQVRANGVQAVVTRELPFHIEGFDELEADRKSTRLNSS